MNYCILSWLLGGLLWVGGADEPPVPNPSFEERTPEGEPVGWRLEPTTPENVAEVTNRHARQGTWSLHLQAHPEGRPYCDAVSEPFPIAPDTEYLLTFAVHGGGNVFTHFYDAEGNALPKVPYYGFGGRRWERAQVRFRAPSGAAQLALRFRAYPGGEIWLDDLHLQPVPPPTYRLPVPNPSLELVDAEGKPLAWNLEPVAAENVAEVTEERARFGRRSLHLRAAPEGKPYCDATTAQFPVGGLTTYTLSFYVQAEREGRVFPHLFAADGNVVGIVGAEWGKGLPFRSEGEGWTRTVLTFTPKAGAASLYLRFRVYPGGEAWIDGVQLEVGPPTDFDPGPPAQLRLALPRQVYVRGQSVPVSLVLGNAGAEPLTGFLRVELWEGRQLTARAEQKVALPPQETRPVRFDLATADLACTDYTLRAAWRADGEVLARDAAEITLIPPAQPTIGFGFYGYVIEGCTGKRFPHPPFVPGNIDRGLDLLASAKMNAFAGQVRWPHQPFLYFLDGAAKRGICFLPLLGLYFGRPALRPEDIALDSEGQQIFVHTSKDRPNLSLLSKSARRPAAELTRQALARVRDHPAFARKVYFGDDVAMWRGKPDIYRGPLQDYSPVARAAFRAKTGRDAPRRRAEELRGVSGVLPDDDPWLEWMRFRSQDILAEYQAVVQRAISEAAPRAVGGPEHGAVWWPGIGAVPTYELGAVGLLTYYAYPPYPPYHLLFAEQAFLGGREKELWATPSAHNNIWGPSFEERTPEYERSSFFSLLTAGAKGITYCPFQAEAQFTEGHPAVWEEFRHQGELVEKFGPLLYRLRRVPSPLGLLLSFSTSAYRVFDLLPRPYHHEDTHAHAVAGTFFALLRAQLPVELVDEESLGRGEAKRYRVLLLTDVQVLPASVYRALTEYVRNGGTVLLDRNCRVEVPGARRLEETFDAHPTSPPERRQAAVAAARRVLYPLVEPLLRCPSDELAVRAFDANGVRALMLLNLRDTEPLTVQVALPAEATVYDVFAERVVETGGMTFRAGEGKLLLLTPTRLEKVTIEIPAVRGKGLRVGNELPYGRGAAAVPAVPFPVTIRLLDAAGQGVPGLQPVRVQFLAPDGRERREYGGYRVAEEGRLELRPTFAVNDPPGEWMVVATDLLGGHVASARFRLEPALSVAVQTLGGQVEAARSEQRVEVALRSFQPEPLTVRLKADFPPGVRITPSPLEVKLLPGQTLRQRLTFTLEDAFYAGPMGGRLAVEYGRQRLVEVPLFFVFPSPEEAR